MEFIPCPTCGDQVSTRYRPVSCYKCGPVDPSLIPAPVSVEGVPSELTFMGNVLLWVAPAILLLFLLSTLKNHFMHHWKLSMAIAGGVGTTIVTGVITAFVFCLTDLFKNKTAARLFYVLLFAGVVYAFVLT